MLIFGGIVTLVNIYIFLTTGDALSGIFVMLGLFSIAKNL